jgi:HK97 family phage prohead protease
MASTEPVFTAAADYSACPGDAPYAVKDEQGNLIACHSRLVSAEKHAFSLGQGDYEGPNSPLKAAPVAANAAARPTTRASVGTETRAITEMEARQGADGTWTVGGYASTFNDPYKVRDQYGTFDETIMPGAWDRSLQNRGHKIQLLALHDSLPHGSTKARNLTLAPDKHGLGFEWKPNPERSDSMNIARGIADGSIDEMSVGMRIPDGGDSWDGDQRSISEATLMEISVVARGANPNTTAGMREEKILAEIRKLEGLMNSERVETVTDDEQDAEWRIRHIENLSRLYKLRF